MVDHNQIKLKIIAATIDSAIECGIEKLTTRQIAKKAGVNETYLYRYFEDKNDLLKQTFILVDQKICSTFESYLDEYISLNIKGKQALKRVYIEFYNKIQKNTNAAKFYLKYYFSNMYELQCVDIHDDIIKSVINKTKYIVKNEAHGMFLYDVIINNMLGHIIKRVQSEETINQLFDFLYNSLYNYIKDDYHKEN